MKEFWKHKSLTQMNQQEWESLCDQCARCCLHKLQDEEDDKVYYTAVACKYLNLKTCQCQDYSNRLSNVEGCINLTPDQVSDFKWLPTSCAYRRLSEGKDLEDWHPLKSGSERSVHRANISVRNKVISENVVLEADMQTYVIHWINS